MPETPPRVGALDALRGLAIVMVLAAHCLWITPWSGFSALIRQLLPGGLLGVDLFFVLSGYLITGILMRTRAQPGYFRRFYIRRALRILPAYYVVLALLLLLLPLATPRAARADLAADAGWYVLHLQNWLFAFDPDPTRWPGSSHFWSLAVEEQFYLFWPLLVFLTPPARLRSLCLWIVGITLATKLALWVAHGGYNLVYMGTLTRMDGLATGGFIATLPATLAADRRRWIGGVGIAAAVGLLLHLLAWRAERDVGSSVIQTTLAAVAFGAAIWLVHAGASGGLLKSRTLRWFGRYSYGIYLLHLPIVMVVREALPRRLLFEGSASNAANLMLGLLALGITLVAALVMYHALEKPALELRHRLAPDPRSPTDVPT